MQKVILYPHGGSGNHGCEALVRSTAKILGADCDLVLVSKAIDQDKKYGLDKLCRFVRQQSGPSLLSRLLTVVRFKLLNDKLAYERQTYRDVLKQVDRDTICLSFGGDNYCYGKPTYIYNMNKLFREKGAKTILWGCSIEPDNIDEEMLQDLRGYHKIIARESLTYNALIDRGLTNVVYHPDPAFTLNVNDDVALPQEFKKDNTVGLNLSPMVLSYSQNDSLTTENYRNLIKHIIEETDMNIALIPHVVWADNDDREPLDKLYSEFKNTGRIFKIDDTDCERLKGVISQCRYLITARTHASIAAYSTGVPTLVLGYSIKAKGIAKDLFGTAEGYVLPVQKLQNPHELLKAFQNMMDREKDMKSLLLNRKKGIYDSAMQMKNELC
ncbi:MAG: polysaccharide pyruvyl transferase family protein [Bacteroidales bacterium]|nr:polysaccharide pyruvyl transferase family protein [Bacteroidales bacterium]